MRKRYRVIFLFCSLLLLAGVRLYPRELGVGLKAGWGRSRAGMTRDLPGIAFDALNEPSCGAFLSFSLFGDHVFLQPEVNFSVKGFVALETDMGGEVVSKYKITYVEIPLLISYRPLTKSRLRPGFFFGPYFGFARKAMEVQTVFGQTGKRDLGDNLMKDDRGIMFGGHLRYRMGRITLVLDARYALGFVSISKNMTEVSYDFSENDAIKNRALTVSLGIFFDVLKRDAR